MMKLKAICIALTLLLMGCKKNETTFDSYFYTSCKSDSPLALYINDVYKGELSYFEQGTMDVNDSIRVTFLNLMLPSGKYKLSAKDKSGNVISETTQFKVKGNSGKLSTSAKCGTGGQEELTTNNRIIYRFF